MKFLNQRKGNEDETQNSSLINLKSLIKNQFHGSINKFCCSIISKFGEFSNSHVETYHETYHQRCQNSFEKFQ